jgi:hypothetical protein
MEYEKGAILNTNLNERKFTRLLQDLRYTGDPTEAKRREGSRSSKERESIAANGKFSTPIFMLANAINSEKN